jgi:hypothetical protein
MARISTYGLDGAITDDDRLFGSSYVSGSGVNKIYNTANYKLSDIVEYLDGKITLAAIDDNAISALQLNVSGNGTSGYVLISDGDGSFSWSSSIPTLTSTSTLTNKTLTSPTITGTGAIAGVFTGNITGNVAGNVAGNITGTVLTATQGTIDHDSLSGFVANEHIDWTVDQGSTEIHSGNYTDTNTNQLTTFTLRGNYKYNLNNRKSR